VCVCLIVWSRNLYSETAWPDLGWGIT